jgi:DNA mismatch repair ATPase MutL
MKKIFIFLILVSFLFAEEGLLLPSDVKSKTSENHNQSSAPSQPKPTPTKQQKTQTQKSKPKQTKTPKPDQSTSQTTKSDTKTTQSEKLAPISDTALENILLSLQQQIAIEKKKNELYKLQKENKEMEEEIKKKITPPQPQPILKEEPTAPYHYIGQNPLPPVDTEKSEIEVVGISKNLAVIRIQDKYYYAREGMKIEDSVVEKITPEGIILRKGNELKMIGLSYQVQVKEKPYQVPTPKEEKK